MSFQLAELPYPISALEPYISTKTMEYHYGKHHRTYLDNLNKLIAGTEFEKMSLEEIIQQSYDKSDFVGIFNNAAQVWNHTFFWNSMKPNGGGEPAPELKNKIIQTFGSYDKFKEAFKNAALTQFGSGWVWLVEEDAGVKIVKTSNADTPIAHNQKPLICIDVWEHAYYLDYQNQRAVFADTFLEHLINWG